LEPRVPGRQIQSLATVPVFDVPVVLDLLPVGVGEVIRGEWRLDDVYWGRDEAIAFQLGSVRGGGSFVVLLMPRDDARRAFRRTAHFDVVHLSHRGRDPVLSDPDALAALERLTSAIAWMDSPPRSWTFPARPPQPAAGEAGPRELNLAVESACGSRCNFCALAVSQPPLRSFDDGYHAWLLRELARGRAGGIVRLRVNGIDPLTYPRIVEVIAHAAAAGYEHVHLLTTALPLADRAFAERVVAAMPAGRAVSVPLYGATAEVHEAVTGLAGSFALVLRALENLRTLLDPSSVQVTMVLVKQSVGEVGAIRELAARHGFSFRSHMPYPTLGGRADPYRGVVPRFEDVVAALHALPVPEPVREAPPCVLYRHERATGIPSLSRICAAQEPGAGTAYRSGRYVHSGGPGLVNRVPTIPCPEAARCSLASRCTKEVYRAYAEVHGLGELQPVDLRA
jgi:MoaA/NifB/PqqE/SkfB family radical SAM enzyme